MERLIIVTKANQLVMNGKRFVASVAGLSIFLLHLASASGDLKNVSLRVEPPLIDYGSLTLSEISQIKTLKGRFQIINNSDRPVKITRITTSCGCTTAKPEREEVASGTSIELVVDINLEGRSGKNKAEVYIEFDNGTIAKSMMLYDIEIQAKIFPIQVNLEKERGKSGQVEVTAYLAFPSPVSEDKLAKIQLLSEGGSISFSRKRVKIEALPNEINGHYYCSIDFEAQIPPEVRSLKENCVLIQDGIEIARSLISIVEKRDLSLKKGVFYLEDVHQGQKVPVEVDIIDSGNRTPMQVRIDDVVLENIKTKELGSGRKRVLFELSWDKAGLSSKNGRISFDSGAELSFTYVANVKEWSMEADKNNTD